MGAHAHPKSLPTASTPPVGACLWRVTPFITQGAPFPWRVGGKMGGGRDWARGGTWAGMGTGGCQAAREGISLTTPNTCAPGSWVSSWGNEKPVRTPRTARRCPGPCQERGTTKSQAPPALPTAAMHPTWGTHSPQQHSNPVPWDEHPELLVSAPQRVPTSLCTPPPATGKAGTPRAPSISGPVGTCSALGHACLSAPAGRWTGIVA